MPRHGVADVIVIWLGFLAKLALPDVMLASRTTKFAESPRMTMLNRMDPFPSDGIGG